MKGAVVMKAPTEEHQRKFNKRYPLLYNFSLHIQGQLSILRNLPVVTVVLDPIVARNTHPHQKEGKYFLVATSAKLEYFPQVLNSCMNASWASENTVDKAAFWPTKCALYRNNLLC